MSDKINHPAHYQHPSGVESIQVCRHENFNRGNAIKYIMRAGKKEGESEIDDLKKALWYINDEIMRIEELNKDAPHAPVSVTDETGKINFQPMVEEIPIPDWEEWRVDWDKLYKWANAVCLDRDGTEIAFANDEAIVADESQGKWMTYGTCLVTKTGRTFRMPNPNYWKRCMVTRPEDTEWEETEDDVNEEEYLEEDPAERKLNTAEDEYYRLWDGGYRLEPTVANAKEMGVDISYLSAWWDKMTARDKARRSKNE